MIKRLLKSSRQFAQNPVEKEKKKKKGNCKALCTKAQTELKSNKRINKTAMKSNAKIFPIYNLYN